MAITVAGFSTSTDFQLQVSTLPTLIRRSITLPNLTITPSGRPGVPAAPPTCLPGLSFDLDLPQGPFLELSEPRFQHRRPGDPRRFHLLGRHGHARPGAAGRGRQRWVRLGDGMTTYVSFSDGVGNFILGSDGLAGELSGVVTVNIPGVTLGGTWAACGSTAARMR